MVTTASPIIMPVKVLLPRITHARTCSAVATPVGPTGDTVSSAFPGSCSNTPRLVTEGNSGVGTPDVRAREARPGVSVAAKARDDLSLGMRVFHQKFGYGIIAAKDGNKLEIDFDSAGRKRVIDSFVSIP